MNTTRFLAHISLLCLLSCRDPASPPSPPSPFPHPDDDDPAQSCASAEQRLLQLGCKDSKGALLGGPNRRGKPFREVCVEAMANRISLRPKCIASVGSCNDVKKCEEDR